MFADLINSGWFIVSQLEFAGREDIPVSEGFRTSLRV
jgi:hypothetical protein